MKVKSFLLTQFPTIRSLFIASLGGFHFAKFSALHIPSKIHVCFTGKTTSLALEYASIRKHVIGDIKSIEAQPLRSDKIIRG